MAASRLRTGASVWAGRGPVTSFIPRLGRISRAGGSARRGERNAPADSRTPPRLNVEYLAGLVPVIRRRLDVPAAFSDEAIFASVAAIASKPTYERRWQAAEASTLGLILLAHGRDLKASLVTLLALLPKPTA